MNWSAKIVPIVRIFTATEASLDDWRWGRDFFDEEFARFVVDARIAGVHGPEALGRRDAAKG